MSTIAFDQFALTRIADFARSLSRLHQASRRQPVDDDAIDRVAPRGLMQPRQRAREIGDAGESELIEGDGGHVVLEFSDRPQMLCRRRAESQ